LKEAIGKRQALLEANQCLQLSELKGRKPETIMVAQAVVG
jgi:hypothetical protein